MSRILKESVSRIAGIAIDILVRESHVRLSRELESGVTTRDDDQDEDSKKLHRVILQISKHTKEDLLKHKTKDTNCKETLIL